jgi:hypothetical protein
MASHCLRELPSVTAPTYAWPSNLIPNLPNRFDSHTSRCMVNAPHLFEDLKFEEVGEVESIKLGLDIKGKGTFKFMIEDDNGMMHKIKIPNSLYIPDLKSCLLSPQHWVQEAKDNYLRPKGTQM